MKTAKFMICAGSMAIAITTPTSVMAQSFEEQMEVQSVLQDLDWQVQIREKQIEVEQLTNELEAVKKGKDTEDDNQQQRNNGQQRVFQYGQQVPQQAPQQEQIPLTAEEIEEQRRQAAREERRTEIRIAEALVDDLRLVEVYAPKGSDELEAVVGFTGGIRTLSEGDKYEGWRVTNVDLQNIEFYHSGLDLNKTLQFIR